MSKPLEPSFSNRTPNGDTHGRDVCDHCEFVNYENPKIVVGSVVRHEGKILLCRRAIEPRKGYWTIPAGYMELGESPQSGAKREAMEEANADLHLSELLAVYTVERLSQVQLIYRATMNSPEFSAGEESLKHRLKIQRGKLLICELYSLLESKPPASETIVQLHEKTTIN